MTKIYERLLSTIIPQGKDRDSFNPRSQTLSGGNSTRIVNRMQIPCVVDCSFYYTIELLWLFYNMSFVLSSECVNQIIVTSVHCYITFMLSSK